MKKGVLETFFNHYTLGTCRAATHNPSLVIEVAKNNEDTSTLRAQSVLHWYFYVVKLGRFCEPSVTSSVGMTHSNVCCTGGWRIGRLNGFCLDALTSLNKDNGEPIIGLASNGEAGKSLSLSFRQTSRALTNLKNYQTLSDGRDMWMRRLITYVAFVIHFFVPLMIQCFPSSVFFAVVLRPCTSLPANASEMAKEINFLPDNTSSETRLRSSGLAKLRTGGKPMTTPPLRPSP